MPKSKAYLLSQEICRFRHARGVEIVPTDILEQARKTGSREMLPMLVVLESYLIEEKSVAYEIAVERRLAEGLKGKKPNP